MLGGISKQESTGDKIKNAQGNTSREVVWLAGC